MEIFSSLHEIADRPLPNDWISRALSMFTCIGIEKAPGCAKYQAAYEWLVHGLVFDVERNDLWLPSWGTKPGTLEKREARVRDLVNAAPKLVPVFGHCYLLAEPCEAGNPVFSTYQSDMIVYGEDLYSYFLHEFWDLLGIERPADGRERQQSLEPYRAIPFWGEILWGEF